MKNRGNIKNLTGGSHEQTTRGYMTACCCGRIKDLSDALMITDTVHEVLGVDGNFCGSLNDHAIRDFKRNKSRNKSR